MSRKRRTKAEIEKDNIDYVINKNKDLIKEALIRYDDLLKENSSSFAFQKVNIEGGRFDFEGKNYYEVLSELTRINVFMADPGSRVKEAKKEVQKYMTLFGKGQWVRTNIYNMTTESTNSTILLNEEAASRAFTAYRNIERNRATEIVNVGGFGSDNFIAYLYSMELQGKDSGIYGEEILEMLREEKIGITRDFSDLSYIPSSYSSVTKVSKKKGDIYETEW